jgi:hypothetical protein
MRKLFDKAKELFLDHQVPILAGVVVIVIIAVIVSLQ